MTVQKSVIDLLNETYDTPIIQYDYDASDNLIYSGISHEFGAADSDDDWLIKKYWYDASDNLIKVKKQIGVWDDRDSLDW